MPDKENTSQPTPVPFTRASEVELVTGFQMPAPFVNKVLLTLAPFLGRLTFLETPPGEGDPVARAAVTMSINDLIELRNLIDRMLEGKTQKLTVGQEQADG